MDKRKRVVPDPPLPPKSRILREGDEPVPPVEIVTNQHCKQVVKMVVSEKGIYLPIEQAQSILDTFERLISTIGDKTTEYHWRDFATHTMHLRDAGVVLSENAHKPSNDKVDDRDSSCSNNCSDSKL